MALEIEPGSPIRTVSSLNCRAIFTTLCSPHNQINLFLLHHTHSKYVLWQYSLTCSLNTSQCPALVLTPETISRAHCTQLHRGPYFCLNQLRVDLVLKLFMSHKLLTFTPILNITHSPFHCSKQSKCSPVSHLCHDLGVGFQVSYTFLTLTRI